MKKPAEVFHPGEFLQDEMEAADVGLVSLSMQSGIRIHRLLSILSQRVQVSKDDAEGLAKAFGTSTEYWLNLQASYDAHKKGAR